MVCNSFILEGNEKRLPYYKDIWNVVLDEELPYKRESDCVHVHWKIRISAHFVHVQNMRKFASMKIFLLYAMSADGSGLH